MEETPQNTSQQLVDHVKQARASGMSDNEIKQELLKGEWTEENIQNALQSGQEISTNTFEENKNSPKLLILVIGIIGILVAGYFVSVQLNKQPNPASSPTALSTPTPTPLLKKVSFSEPLPITWTGWNRAKVGLVSAELKDASIGDIPGMDKEIKLKDDEFHLVLNFKIKVQDGGFCTSSLGSSMRLVLENEEFAAPIYTQEDCGQNFTTLNDQKVVFAVKQKAPEYLFRTNELFGSSGGSKFYFRVTQAETVLAANEVAQPAKASDIVIAKSRIAITAGQTFALTGFPNTEFTILRVIKASGGTWAARCGSLSTIIYVNSFQDRPISKGCIDMNSERLQDKEPAIIAIELEIANNGALPIDGRFLRLFYENPGNSGKILRLAEEVPAWTSYGTGPFSSKRIVIGFLVPKDQSMVHLYYGSFERGSAPPLAGDYFGVGSFKADFVQKILIEEETDVQAKNKELDSTAVNPDAIAKEIKTITTSNSFLLPELKDITLTVHTVTLARGGERHPTIRCANRVSADSALIYLKHFGQNIWCLDMKHIAGFLNGSTPEAIGVTLEMTNGNRNNITYAADAYVQVYYQEQGSILKSAFTFIRSESVVGPRESQTKQLGFAVPDTVNEIIVAFALNKTAAIESGLQINFETGIVSTISGATIEAMLGQ